MDEITRIKNYVEQLKGQKNQLESSIEKKEEKLRQLQFALRRTEKAKEIVKLVALKTQSQLSFHISEITTLAMEAVLDNPYELKLEFVQRRDKTECDLSFVREDIEIKPYDGGGGPIDIASFALRVASWSMQTPKTRNTLILDEPFKHLKGEAANRKMLDMVSQLSKKLNLQIIMVSDERVSRGATVEATDRLFETKIKKGVTKIIVEE